MLLAAYYGLFRIGELVKGDHPVLVKDVYMGTNKNKLMFILRSSKTHTRGDPPQTIKISSIADTSKGDSDEKSGIHSANHYCPFKILKEYSLMRPKYKRASEQFFIYKDRSPVKATNIAKILKNLLKSGGFNYRLYSFHSLRAGRGVDLLEIRDISGDNKKDRLLEI